MRLDRFMSETGMMSRRDAAKAVKAGKITVNGVKAVSPDTKIDEESDIVEYDGCVVNYSRYTYIMLNKPEGYLSSTDDPNGRTVTELLDIKERKMGLFPCGRLDKDSTGLIIMTNDGPLAHRLLSPKHHCEKKYIVDIVKPLDDPEMLEMLENGIDIGEGIKTLPAKLCSITPIKYEITLFEGKYHQIKRMFEAVGNKVVNLRRISFGGIDLDRKLKSGEWRYLSENEIETLKKSGK